MKRPIQILAFAAMALFAGAAPAATVVTISVSGVVASGTDDIGTFGAIGTDLTASAFSLVYAFRVDDLVRDTLDVPGFLAAWQYSGPSPLSSAVLTIGNAAQSFSGAGLAATARYLFDPVLGAPKTLVSYNLYDSNSGYSISSNVRSFSTLYAGLDPTEDFAYAITAADRSDGTTATILSGTNQSDIRFDARQIASVATVTSPAAVPEPAAWAMMIIGFGATGAALRRRGTASGAARFA